MKKKEFPQRIGKVEKDYGGEKVIEFTVEETDLKIDYNFMSIGVDLERSDVWLSRIE